MKIKVISAICTFISIVSLVCLAISSTVVSCFKQIFKVAATRVLLPVVAIYCTSFVTNAALAVPVYLNIDNISVVVGSNTSAGSFNNTFDNSNTIIKVIDAPSANAEEFHDQITHIWFTANEVGGGLELLFDFGQAFDISTLHFWNYTSESFDVDNVDFTFFNQSNVQVGALSVQPALGSSPGILAEDIVLVAPINVQFVTAFLTGTNRQVDFQNIGFTAELSQVPVPAAVWLFGSGLIGLIGYKKRKVA